MFIRNDVTPADIANAEQILLDNGIIKDEVETVLQAIGYALLDEELYPDGGVYQPTEPRRVVDVHISETEDDFLPDFDSSRIYQPYEVFHLLKDRYTAEDIESELETVLEDGDYDVPDEVLQKLPKKLVEGFNKALSMNDTYWDCFWMQIRSVIEDAIKEYEKADDDEPDTSWRDAGKTMPDEGVPVIIVFADKTMRIADACDNKWVIPMTSDEVVAWTDMPPSWKSNPEGWTLLLEDGCPKCDGHYIVETENGWFADLDYSVEGGWVFGDWFDSEIYAWRPMPEFTGI